jgi:hypothetical protein
VFLIEGEERLIYLALDQAQHLGRLTSRFPDFTEKELERILEDFCDHGLCLHDGDHYIALAMRGRARQCQVREV